MSRFPFILSLALTAGALLPGAAGAEVTFAADNLNMSGNRITNLGMAPSPADGDAVNMAYVKALEARIAALETLLEHFTRSGDQIYITGANLHVRSGTTEERTNAEPNGLGNVIIGYDEARTIGDPSCSLGQYDNEMQCTSNGGTWAISHKSGSHNLVVGMHHNYSRYGGLVVGVSNTISGDFASVSGGEYSTASGYSSAISGGRQNTASNHGSAISGGWFNTASGSLSSISGGRSNTASGDYSAVSGGRSNTASGDDSATVSGGFLNAARGDYSAVSGGSQRSVTGEYDWRAGSLFEDF